VHGGSDVFGIFLLASSARCVSHLAPGHRLVLLCNFLIPITGKLI